ncbi:MAG TPA: hypothetical protein VFB79_00520 [Candidatus Angelobacter sp.]|nr:hypothetical protein [Candidatus Angelobacter sp.]
MAVLLLGYTPAVAAEDCIGADCIEAGCIAVEIDSMAEAERCTGAETDLAAVVEHYIEAGLARKKLLQVREEIFAPQIQVFHSLPQQLGSENRTLAISLKPVLVGL